MLVEFEGKLNNWLTPPQKWELHLLGWLVDNLHGHMRSLVSRSTSQFGQCSSVNIERFHTKIFYWINDTDIGKTSISTIKQIISG